MTDEKLHWDPLPLYKEEVAPKFKEKLEQVFQQCLEESGIDVEANRKSVAEYEELGKQKGKAEKTLKILQIIFVVLCIALPILLLMSFDTYGIMMRKFSTGGDGLSYLLKLIEEVLLLFICSFLVWKRLRAEKAECRRQIEEGDQAMQAKREEGLEQLAPLLDLFERSMAKAWIQDSFPNLHLDEYFHQERYADLVENYGLLEEMEEKMANKDLLSGDFLGNPFVMAAFLENQVVDECYRGSLTVSWTEYYTDHEGKQQSRQKSETLYASIVRPKQIFVESLCLCYGNDACEHLHFSRLPNFIHEMKESKLKNHKKKQAKALQKHGEKALKKGGSFQEMGNVEFDSLFGAWDRDQETEFRIMFTAEAQRNMLKLLLDKDFGDDFAFYKMGKINLVQRMEACPLNVEKGYYSSFSFDEVKKRFFGVNQNFCKKFYQVFAPILSIPVYKQHKAKKYIYQENYEGAHNPYLAEYMAYLLGENLFDHKDSHTESILKARLLESEGEADLWEVSSLSYQKIARTAYVSVTASNGSVYQVPVPWTEYIPVEGRGRMELKAVDTLERAGLEGRAYRYEDKILALYTEEEHLEKDILTKI